MIVVYDEALGNHAIRAHLQRKMAQWLAKEGVDQSRIGPLLLFTTRDIEDFEELAHRLGAENVMRDYAAHVEQNPYDRNSMFHTYAMLRYPEEQVRSGFAEETLTRVLTTVQDEFNRRKQAYSEPTISGEI
jgi:hypothetical protein